MNDYDVEKKEKENLSFLIRGMETRGGERVTVQGEETQLLLGHYFHA